MLQHHTPDTFVLATNRTETVRRFVEIAFAEVGIALDWEGVEQSEVGTERGTGRTLVRVNPQFYRPAEVDLLIGDPAKARAELGWGPAVELEELARLMVAADMRRNRAGWSF
jgi:GDPmannose 4,6-dehydratase